MKNLFSLMVAFMAIFGFGFDNLFGPTTAWAAYTEASRDEGVRSPTVPIEVFRMGRQEVFRHLLLSVQSVQVEITGRSVVTQGDNNTYYISHQELESKGYKFNGSFSELSDVIDSYEYRVKVISMASGGYDVSMKIRYIDSEGNTALLGSSWLSVSSKAGSLFSTAEPWVDMPENINVSFPGNNQHWLKWFSGKYDDLQPVEFITWADSAGQGSTTLHGISTSKLGYGYLSVSGPDGKLSVLDLANGGELAPQDLFVLMNKTGSASLTVINNPKALVTWNNSVRAYRMDNGIYGRVPILEVVNLNSDVDEWVNFGIQVGSSNTLIYPFNVKVISLEDGKTVFLERNDSGLWHLKLQKGAKYHILIDYGDQIIDWSAGPGLG